MDKELVRSQLVGYWVATLDVRPDEMAVAKDIATNYVERIVHAAEEEITRRTQKAETDAVEMSKKAFDLQVEITALQAQVAMIVQALTEISEGKDEVATKYSHLVECLYSPWAWVQSVATDLLDELSAAPKVLASVDLVSEYDDISETWRYQNHVSGDVDFIVEIFGQAQARFLGKPVKAILLAREQTQQWPDYPKGHEDWRVSNTVELLPQTDQA